MKIIIFKAIILSFLLSVPIYADTTIRFEFGKLTNSQSDNIQPNTLWAIITQNTAGDLPGGLATDGAFSVTANIASISSDFAGQTIDVGQQIGGGDVLAVGGSFSSPLGELGSTETLTNDDYTDLGLNAGDKFGLYWFPGRTPTSNTIPINTNFEIGGFQRNDASIDSGGETGMIIPTNGIELIDITYFDSSITGGDTSFDDSFQAIVIPEPSVLVLMPISVFLLLLRRRC